MLANKIWTYQGVNNLKQPNIDDDFSSPTNINLGVWDLKQPNVIDNSNSPLSFLSSIGDMPDPEKSE